MLRTLTKIGTFATMRSPYQILGVKPNASPQQIKKSYRVIAQKYHPDKNPDPSAQKMFVQAKQAYQILIDEDKRRQYDNQHTPKSQGFNKNPFDEFNDEMFRDKTLAHLETQKDRIFYNKYRQVFQMLPKDYRWLNFDRKATCPTCHGNKCKPGTAPTRCLACGGSGTVIYRRAGVVMHLQCQRCKGVGYVIKHPCTDCNATGVKSQRVTQNINIPPGSEDGQTVTLRQKGDQSQNGPSGDLVIKVKVVRHPNFRKAGQDIHSTEWLTISQAALGTNRKIKTIWGDKILNVPGGSQDGSLLSLKGQGVQGMIGKGNHLVTLRIRIPTRLTDKQKKIFEELSKEQESAEQQQAQEKQAQSVFDKMKKAFK